MLDVVLDMMKQTVQVVQVFRNVVFIICPAVSVVMGEVVDVEAVFEHRVYLTVGFTVTSLMLVIVMHFPADRVRFSSKPISQRIHMTSRTKCVMSPIMRVLSLHWSNTAMLDAKDGDDCD